MPTSVYLSQLRDAEDLLQPEYISSNMGFYEMEQYVKRLTLMDCRKRLAERHPALLKFDVFEEASPQGVFNVLPAYIDEILTPRSIDYIDSDESLIPIAKRKQGTLRRNYTHGTVENLPYEDSCFDVVVDFSTTDHVTDEGAFLDTLRGVHRVMRPGGYYLLYHDNADYMNPRKWEAEFADLDAPPSKPRRSSDVRRMLENIGFTIEVERFLYPFLYDKTLPLYRAIEFSKFLRGVVPAIFKHTFFNVNRANYFFFLLARK